MTSESFPYTYIDQEEFLPMRVFYYLTTVALKFLGWFPMFPPVTKEKPTQQKFWWSGLPDLIDLAGHVGFNVDAEKTTIDSKALLYHKERLSLLRNLIVWVFYGPGYVVMAIIAIMFFFDMTPRFIAMFPAPASAIGQITSTPSAQVTPSVSATPTSQVIAVQGDKNSLLNPEEERKRFLIALQLLPLIYLGLLIVLKLVNSAFMAILNRYFIESICVAVLINVLLSLKRDDILVHSDQRKDLLDRVNYLARGTLLLPYRFGSDSKNNQDELERHFKNIEEYIRERERSIATPVGTSLSALRKDFFHLACIYIFGYYGEFLCTKEAAPVPTPPKSSTLREILPTLTHITGIFLPLTILGIPLLRNEYLFGLEPRQIAIIFIAWLLLSIDFTLKLGIIAGLINLAKEIKDLK